jgi:hypothetical protein
VNGAVGSVPDGSSVSTGGAVHSGAASTVVVDIHLSVLASLTGVRWHSQADEGATGSEHVSVAMRAALPGMKVGARRPGCVAG